MMAFFGLLYLLPIAWSLAVQDGAVIDFVAAALINAFAGLGLASATRRYRRELKPRDGFLLVSLSWALMSASAAVPFMIALPDLTFHRRLFRSRVRASPPPARRCSTISTTCRSRSTCGGTRCTGSAASASSCWRSPCCRCWASAACSCTRPRRPARSRTRSSRRASPRPPRRCGSPTSRSPWSASSRCTSPA